MSMADDIEQLKNSSPKDLVPNGDAQGVKISGVPNARGIGGYVTADGRKIKDGLFFRTAGLNFMDDRGPADLHRLGIKVVVDLRTPWEASRWPYQLSTDIRVEKVSLLRDDYETAKGKLDQSDQDTKPDMGSMYHDIAFGSADRVIGILRELIDNDGHPMLIHCTAGKDRTGIVSGVLMSLLGVDDDLVISSYSESAENLGQAFKEAVAVGLPSDAKKAINLEGAEAALLASPPQLMRNLLAAIRGQYGSVESYCLENGMQGHEVADLRRLFLY